MSDFVPFDLPAEMEQFRILKVENQRRNLDYYLNRQAVEGNFRWPRDWPNHIPKVKHNFCKPIVDRFSTFLMGKQFTTVVGRPNTLEFRETAERCEKILKRLSDLSHGEVQFMTAAQVGSVVGRSVFRVYKQGKKGAEHASFKACQPDYFYGIQANEQTNGDYAKVFYSYPIDRTEAVRLYGPNDYKSEAALSQADRYDPIPEDAENVGYVTTLRRRVPVTEVWTRENYALVVGGITVYNDVNPHKWSSSGEGFIPYVVVENMRNDGQTVGESDVEQVREINEQYNYLLSRKQYVVGRWLVPTMVWEGAPQNYLEILTATIGGGGVIPTRVGSRLYFLAYDHANPAVAELEISLRQAILETAGLNEIAFMGTVHGYVNSGTSVGAQYEPVAAVIDKKRSYWQIGIQSLYSMLLEIQEEIGDSKVLGLTVVNASVSSKDGSDGQVVQLSGKDIAGLRDVAVTWPGILPKDDHNAATLELQKSAQGLQSLYTTIQKLGEDFPDDEIARIREENTDPSLKGSAVAEQTRANAMATTAQANASGAQGPGEPPMQGGPSMPPPNPAAQPSAPPQAPPQGQPQMQDTGGDPVIGPGGH